MHAGAIVSQQFCPRAEISHSTPVNLTELQLRMPADGHASSILSGISYDAQVCRCWAKAEKSLTEVRLTLECGVQARLMP